MSNTIQPTAAQEAAATNLTREMADDMNARVRMNRESFFCAVLPRIAALIAERDAARTQALTEAEGVVREFIDQNVDGRERIHAAATAIRRLRETT